MDIDKSLEDIIKTKSQKIGKGGARKGLASKARGGFKVGTRQQIRGGFKKPAGTLKVGAKKRLSTRGRGGLGQAARGSAALVNRALAALQGALRGGRARGRGRAARSALPRSLLVAAQESVKYTRGDANAGKWTHDLYEGPARRQPRRALESQHALEDSSRSVVQGFGGMRGFTSDSPRVAASSGDLRATLNAAKVPASLQDRLNRKPQLAADGQLTVSNLEASVTQKDIQDLFGAEGTVTKTTLRNGTATVVFANPEEAVAAMKKYNGVTLDGKPMRITKAKAGGLFASAIASVASY